MILRQDHSDPVYSRDLPIFTVSAGNYRAGFLTPEITVILFTLQLNLPGIRNYVASS